MGDAFDDFVIALAELDQTLDDCASSIFEIRDRIGEIQRAHARGDQLRSIVPSTPHGPMIVRTLAEIGSKIALYGAQVRRTQARALIAEGLSAGEIAELYGVSRQRISKVLQEEEEDGSAELGV